MKKIDWKQAKNNTIEVVFAGQHLDEYFYDYENKLKNLGLVATKRRYDKKLNQTITTYKRVKNAA